MKTLPELFEIVQTYEPEIIWSDGDWGSLIENIFLYNNRYLLFQKH